MKTALTTLSASELTLRVTTRALEGAALGGGLGAVSGALLGASVASGSMVVPAIGWVVAGPIVAAFMVAGALGAIGALLGAAVGWRIPRFVAR